MGHCLPAGPTLAQKNLRKDVVRAGIVQFCTIRGNTALDQGGGLFSTVTGTTGPVVNTIIYFNTSPDGANHKAANGSVITYSNNCTTPAVSGTGNITNNPQFMDADVGRCRLVQSSPCVNAGLDMPWMTGAKDLSGDSRLIRAAVDIGAYELYLTGTVIVVR